ncbi:MAG TPA: class I SAM-dependent methyltransferase [Vicinamibacterales bacterium]|nr:class I SAM-dependent methyltransferase [Vicinamibacterales bacterium]
MDRLLEATARAERDHFWFRGLRRFVRPLLHRASGGRNDLRILDCGCGTGHNLNMLRRFGRAIGIDLTLSGLKYAASRGDGQLAQASADRLPFSAGIFDLVTSFDVIYSLPDEVERAAVAEMFRVLKPGGYLVLNVAAMPILHGSHSVLSGEIRRYSKPGLRRLLEAAGFQIDRLTYTNASTLPITAAVRFAQRLAGHQASAAEIGVPAAPVNAALGGMLALESLALRLVDMPAGSSLLALARKRSGHSTATE